jgi:hypothetical protein
MGAVARVDHDITNDKMEQQDKAEYLFCLRFQGLLDE